MNALINLMVSCKDQLNIVATVASFIAHNKGSIVDADQHLDKESSFFFMRYQCIFNHSNISPEQLAIDFQAIAKTFRMSFCFTDCYRKKKVVLLTSKESHCLEDVLYRTQFGELPCEIIAVISNHETLADRVSWYQIPFHYIPVNKGNRNEHFKQVAHLLQELQPDLILLAKYMQILPEFICQKYSNQIINIHHSFLPAFVGAKPYYQAFISGVKIIGATAHYVTKELDKGPIIDQETTRISHRDNVNDFIRRGKNVEREVLARATLAHLEDRVIIHNNKTIIF